MQIITTYPGWYLIVCCVLGAVFTALLYWRNRQLVDFPKTLIAILSVIRFTAISLLAFFLLEPMLKLIQQEVEQPVVVIGIDNSESMVLSGDSALVKEFVNEQFPAITSALGEGYTLRTYSFGQSISEDVKGRFNEQQTDISQFIAQIQNRYSNRNLGAVLIASDGLYNKGLNPIHQSRNFNTPIYTIAFGDTTPQRDVYVAEVIHNELAYLGNTFPIEVDLRSHGFDGSTAKISVSHNGVELISELTTFDGKDAQYITRFLLTANETGMQRYSVAVEPLDGEYTEVNNRRDVFIEVLDSKQKILFIANAPHPDVRALRSAIEDNDNYELELISPDDPLPPLEGFHLAILHELPSRRHPADQLIQKIRRSGLPAWFILGEQTDLSSFNSSDAGLMVTDTRPTFNSASAAFNPTFSLFNVDAQTGNYFGTLPPLTVPFGEFQQTAQGQVLMFQRIGSVKTEYPLWLFAEQDGWKSAVLCGSGIWRWRTMGFADKGSHETFNTLVRQTVQYLASRENKQFLRVSGARSYKENEDIVFRAECYNPSYELYTDPSVQMVITDDEDNNFEFNFSRTGNAYRLNAGQLPPGNYAYRVVAENNAVQQVATGSFSVEDVNVESILLTANHNLLYQLSSSTGGKMFYPDQAKTFVDAINDSDGVASVVYERKELSDLIRVKWIFFVLLGLFAIEWFIRKRNGAY